MDLSKDVGYCVTYLWYVERVGGRVPRSIRVMSNDDCYCSVKDIRKRKEFRRPVHIGSSLCVKEKWCPRCNSRYRCTYGSCVCEL